MNRPGTPPVELARQLAAEDPGFAAASGLAPLLNLPPIQPLGELRRPDRNDGNELIKDRFLCRGGSLLFVGPTGVGKSSFTMQAAILWALGHPCFGLRPARALRILIVQAENDEGDLAEMRDGVMAGLELSPEQRAAAAGGISVVTEDAKTREGFAALLDTLLRAHEADLVIVDPAFAYLGGDASSQRDVSVFLRNILNPVVHRHNVGLVLVHHVNKPPAGEQKSQWQAGDYAYLGSGSAEFANWARAVMAIRSLGSPTVFELLLAKRGRRAGWTDGNGQPMNRSYIAYHRDPATICWRYAESRELAPYLSDAQAVTAQTVVDLIQAGNGTKKALSDALMREYGLKKTAAYDAIAAAIQAGAIREGAAGPHNVTPLTITGKVPPSPIQEENTHEPIQ